MSQCLFIFLLTCCCWTVIEIRIDRGCESCSTALLDFDTYICNIRRQVLPTRSSSIIIYAFLSPTPPLTNLIQQIPDSLVPEPPSHLASLLDMISTMPFTMAWPQHRCPRPSCTCKARHLDCSLTNKLAATSLRVLFTLEPSTHDLYRTLLATSFLLFTL